VATNDDTLPIDVTLREVVAAQLLIATGEKVDGAALESLNRKLDAQLDAFRKHLGVVRFGAVLKNAWRRAESPAAEE
jgi:hypothetical protein